MGTGRRRTSLAVRVRVELAIDPAPAELAVVVASGEPVVRVGLVELAARVAQAALAASAELAVRAALVVPEDLVVRAALVVPENPVVRAVPAALVVPEDPVVPVAPENPAALVVLGDPVVPAGLELDPVEAELAHARVAVPALRSKSVTAAHPRDLARVPKRAEDLAEAAAATMRGQAATEAATAWAAVE
jgi:hypothetical protein